MNAILAQEVPELPVYGFTPDLGGLLSAVITVLLPILVGLVTTRLTSSAVKGLLLLAVAAIKVFIETWLNSVNLGTDFEPGTVAITILINFVIAVAVHYGLWKPTGVTARAQDSLVTDRSSGPRA